MVLTRELLAELEDSGAESVDTDNLSLTSTVQSEQGYEYPVERILAEKPGTAKVDDGTNRREPANLFLVKWEGYPLMRSTWEPEENFLQNVQDTLITWKNDQLKAQAGFSEPFPLEKFRATFRRRRDREHRRHARRRRKRERLDLSPGPPSETSNDQVLVDWSDDENALSKQSAKETSPLFLEDSGSDSDVPLAKRRRTSAPAHERQKSPTFQTVKSSGKAKSPQEAQEATRTVVTPQTSGSGKPEANAASHTNITNTGYFSMTSALPRKPPVANMMRTSGPSKSSTKKSTATKGKTSVSGASVMDNWDKRKEKRSKSTTNLESAEDARKGRHAPTLQVRNFIQKASTRERPPAHIPDLIELSSGSTIKGDPPPLSRHSTAPLMPTAAAAAPVQHITPPTKPKTSNERGPFYTCWFWRNGTCAAGSDCPFEHYETGHPIPLKNRLRKDQMTCKFYATSGCKRLEKDCLYSHKLTNYIGPAPGQPPIRYAVFQEAQPSQATTVRGDRDKRVMCHFWFHGNQCQVSAEKCKFAHTITDGLVAGHPTGGAQSWKKPTPDELRARGALIPAATVPGRNDEAEDIAMEMNSSSPSSPFQERAVPSPSLPDSPKPPSTVQTPVSPRPPTFPSQVGSDEMYRQRKMWNETSDVILTTDLNLQCGSQNDESKINVRLLCNTASTKSNLNADLRYSPVLSTKHICVAEDARKYIDVNKCKIYGYGDVLPSQSDEFLRKLSDNLLLHSAGAIFFHNKFNLLIYPFQYQWSFLKPKTPTDKDARLQFHVLSPYPPPETLGRINWKEPGEIIENEEDDDDDDDEVMEDLSQDIEKSSVASSFARGLDIDRLFRWLDKDNDVTKAVFLMLDPKKYKDDLEELSNCLRDSGAEVYHPGQVGSWEAFNIRYCGGSGKRSGVVLFAPGFASYHKVPNLSTVIRHQFNFFQFERLRHGSEPPTPGPTNNKLAPLYWPSRIFPHGRIVFITDDCFLKEPSDALRVVQFLIGRMKQNPSAWSSVQLVGRPGLMNWLQLLAKNEISTDDFGRSVESVELKDRVKTWELLDDTLHMKPEFLETSLSNMERNPTRKSPIYYLPPSSMSGYANLSERNPKMATNQIVEWFMAYSCEFEQLRHFRKFCIVTMADSNTRKNWKNNWKFGEIFAPSAYLKDEEKRNNTSGKKK